MKSFPLSSDSVTDDEKHFDKCAVVALIPVIVAPEGGRYRMFGDDIFRVRHMDCSWTFRRSKHTA